MQLAVAHMALLHGPCDSNVMRTARVSNTHECGQAGFELALARQCGSLSLY
jgi:hypothetical protein